MTNQERAEKILAKVIHNCAVSDDVDRVVLIAVELDAMVKEAWGKDDLDHFARVRDAALEEAASITDGLDYGNDTCPTVSQRIRARKSKPEVNP